MSECMTIDVFAAEEKYPDEELTTAKDIVRSILSEALHSVVVSADKDSNHIGDCKVGEEFLPEFGCFPVNCSGSEEIGESCEEKKIDEEEKSKEYKVIKDQALADSELRIQNGKIHLQANGAKAVVNLSREPTNFAEICPGKEVNKSQSCVKGGSDKNVESSSENVLVVKSGQEKPEECRKEGEQSVDKRGEECAECERPFTPFTTEDLRKSILQVWKNVNSPALNGWDGKLVDQPEEVVKLMEELATIRVTADPNRPRACTFIEEDVKKMIQDLEDMNFKTSLPNAEEVGATQDKGAGMEEGIPPGEVEAGDGDQEEGSPEVGQLLSVPSDSAAAMESEKFNENFDFEGKEGMFPVSLTESDEAFIESSESVIQIIEPQDDSNDENEEGGKISFSLLNEPKKDGEMMAEDYENHGHYDDAIDREEEEEMSPRYRSGMTTVGPIKYQNYDPKVLTGPEVDFGRMTRINGSRELKKEKAEGSSRSSSSRKVVLDDSEDSPMIFFENGYMEFDSIVNHDIASLTKMQKVKEVLSDQPKSDEDLRSDEKLMRSPLDLKDVDADSCDSYNVIDIGIPLLTIEETNRNNQNKDIGENAQAIVNDGNVRNRETRASNSEEKNPETKISAEKVEGTKAEAAKSDSTNDETPVKVEEHLLISSSFSYNKSVTQLNSGQGQKHNTISRVFQKASNRFIMKDSDSFLRNSRSLPRDTSKITNTESFRSLLDDCQTSAATVLKKSRSLLRNTQNALKAVSKTGFGHVVSGDKQVYAAPDIAVEKADSSSSSKKNEFLKLKDTIKSKVGKTLKSFESVKTGNDRQDKKSGGIDQKKLSPKSPLVCANQLPPKQSCENRKIECEGSATFLEDRREDSFHTEEDVREESRTFEPDDDGNESPDKEIEVICGVKFQGTRRLSVSNGYPTSPQDKTNDAATDLIDYVVMETIRDNAEPQSADEEEEEEGEGALDAAGLERPKSATGAAAEGGKLPEAKKSLTLPVDTAEILEEYIGGEGLSTAKLRRKNKKLSARIRSFWQTAFGKAKAPAQKKDLS